MGLYISPFTLLLDILIATISETNYKEYYSTYVLNKEPIVIFRYYIRAL